MVHLKSSIINMLTDWIHEFNKILNLIKLLAKYINIMYNMQVDI